MASATKETVYEVLADQLTLHKLVASLQQPDGSTINQNGMGKVWLKGELVPESEISPDYIDALNDTSNVMHKHIVKKLKKSSGESKEDVERRLGLPFEGIDTMDEDELLEAMRHLPSVVVARIKEYEEKKEDSRSRIVNYNVGFGEETDARQLGKAGSGLQSAEENKPSSELQTREVPDSGPVIQGDGVTGIGVPAKGKLKNPGSVLEGAKIKKAAANAAATKRSGRRSRSTSSDKE